MFGMDSTDTGFFLVIAVIAVCWTINNISEHIADALIARYTSKSPYVDDQPTHDDKEATEEKRDAT
jgi:hypothetical protein